MPALSPRQFTWTQPSSDPGAVPTRDAFIENEDGSIGYEVAARQLGTKPWSKQPGPDRGSFAADMTAPDGSTASTVVSTMHRAQIAARTLAVRHSGS